MSTKKPWRTVITGTSTGRFTREQIRDAIDSVSKSKAGGAQSRGDGAASQSTPRSDDSAESGTVAAQTAKTGGTVQGKSTGGARGQTAGSSARKGAPKSRVAAASKNGGLAKPRKGPHE